MDFQHFLITRFNLPIKAYEHDKHGVITASEEWLSQRYDLFLRYCFPSVAAQTSKNFLWIVLFYDKTPAEYRDLNVQLSKQFPSFIPCYLSDDDVIDTSAYVSARIHELLPEKTDYVVSTRIDNDDSLAIDAMECIERIATDQWKGHPFYIVLSHGSQYHVQYNMSLDVQWEHNHFNSLVEPVNQTLETVLSSNHMKLEDLHEVVCCNSVSEMWMEVCHNTNVLNDVYYKWLFKPMKHGYNAQRFGISSPPPYKYNLLKFRLLRMPLNACNRMWHAFLRRIHGK